MATRRIGQVDRVVATDGELVMRVRNGDQAALAAIYDRYVARLVDLARAIVGPSGAEDVVHDAFVGAAGRIDQLRDRRGGRRSDRRSQPGRPDRRCARA